MPARGCLVSFPPRGRRSEMRPQPSSDWPIDTLGFEVFLEAGRSPFAAETAVLVAPKGAVRVGPTRTAVDMHHAGAKALRQQEPVLRIGSPHRTGQSIWGVIGDGGRFVIGAERDDHADWAEDLFASDAH